MTGRKLLLADDSATIQKVIDLTFSDEGMQVITVGDGEQAIRQLEQFTPDIVLADVLMPGLDGYRLCEFIKQSERFGQTPVMLLVGSFEPFDEAEARRVGADDFVTKPFQSIRQLVSRVGSLLSGKGAAQNAATTELSTFGIKPVPASSQVSAAAAATTEPDLPGTGTMAEHEPQDLELQTADTLKFGPEELADTLQPNGESTHFHDDTFKGEPMDSTNPTMSSTTDFSDALLDLDELDAGAAVELDDVILDLEYEAPVAVAAPSDSPAVSSAEEFSAAGRTDRWMEEPAVAEYELSEPSTVEVPVSSWSIVEEPHRVEDATASAKASVETGRASRQIALEELSPEAIDAIARRVIEQLSDKVIREIAWEVVPELSELLIKQKLDEQKS